MKVSSLFLANAAEVRDGLLYALGAFPEWLSVPAVPGRLLYSVVIALDLEEADLGRRQHLYLHLVRPDGKSQRMAEVHLTAIRPATDRRVLRQVIAVPVTPLLEVEGVHTVLLVDAKTAHLASTEIVIRTSRGGPPPPAPEPSPAAPEEAEEHRS